MSDDATIQGHEQILEHTIELFRTGQARRITDPSRVDDLPQI